MTQRGRLGVAKKLAQRAGEPGQVLGGSQSSGPVAFGECLTRRSPSKRERDAPQPRSIPNIKVWSHHSYDGSATVDKIAQPSGNHPFCACAAPMLNAPRRLSRGRRCVHSAPQVLEWLGAHGRERAWRAAHAAAPPTSVMNLRRVLAHQARTNELKPVRKPKAK